MPNITTLTRPQLQALNAGQLRAAVNQVINAWDKQQLMTFLLDQPTYWDDPVMTYTPSGQYASRIDVERENASAAQMSKKTTAWTYYDGDGAVDTIILVEYDANNVEKKRKTIKHYQDGRQPEVT